MFFIRSSASRHWGVSVFRLLWITLVWMRVCKYQLKSLFLVLRCIAQEWNGESVFNSCRNHRPVLPRGSAWHLISPLPCQALLLSVLSLLAILACAQGCFIVVLLYSFLMTKIMLNIFSCAHWPFVHLPGKNVCSSPLPIFLLGGFFLFLNKMVRTFKKWAPRKCVLLLILDFLGSLFSEGLEWQGYFNHLLFLPTPSLLTFLYFFLVFMFQIEF